MRGQRACAEDRRGDSRSRRRAGRQRRIEEDNARREGGRLSWRRVRVDFVNPKGLNEKRCNARTCMKPNYGNNNGTDDGETLVPYYCGLIHRIRKGFFAKHPTEKPNHGTLAYFISRYRYRFWKRTHDLDIRYILFLSHFLRYKFKRWV
jgi:hypothetical protein